MDIFVLFGLYADKYEAYIEPLTAVGDYTVEQNPAFLQDEINRVKGEGGFQNYKLVKIRISDEARHKIELALGMHEVEVVGSLLEVEGDEGVAQDPDRVVSSSTMVSVPAEKYPTPASE
jgi:hypothetical protein